MPSPFTTSRSSTPRPATSSRSKPSLAGRIPSRGFVQPDTFIPLAEDSGLIIDLGRAVLLEACQQAREWQDRFPQLQPSISVNVSRLQLAHPSFIEHVADALARADLDPSSLTLEVTESVLAGESGRIIAALDELRRTGVRVAIDDFGTGYSSFAALAELPIDILKIDKRFIDNIARDDEGRGFVNAIMQLAQTLHLDTIAEGVEQPEQREALTELGCTHIQGYLFSPAMPGEQTAATSKPTAPAAGTRTQHEESPPWGGPPPPPQTPGPGGPARAGDQ